MNCSEPCKVEIVEGRRRPEQRDKRLGRFQSRDRGPTLQPGEKARSVTNTKCEELLVDPDRLLMSSSATMRWVPCMPSCPRKCLSAPSVCGQRHRLCVVNVTEDMAYVSDALSPDS
jgi:hypothetical protein